MQSVSLDPASTALLDLLQHVEQLEEPVLLEREGKAVAVLLTLSDYALLEDLEDARDRMWIAEVKAREEEFTPLQDYHQRREAQK